MSNKEKKKAKKRDNHTCQKCSRKPSNSRDIHAHHIVPSGVGGSDSVDNFVSLCNKCHEYAPEPHTPCLDWERLNELYVGTNLRPEWDFMYFGVLITKKGNSVTESKLFYEQSYRAHYLDEIPNRRSSSWVSAACMADYLDIRDVISVFD